MGLINSALNIGRSAITSYQSALSVLGNNIANAADPDYSRQRPVLEPVAGGPLPEGIRPGGGVALTSLERIVNEGLETRVREAIAAVEASKVESQTLSQIEASLNELTDNDLSSQMNQLFNSFQDVQNNPTEVGLRGVTVGHAAALADALRTRRNDLESMITEINDQINSSTEQINDLTRQIADLNIQIVSSEAGGQLAGALRDSRDALLKDLSRLMNITVRHQESGTVSVFVGNETLVQYGEAREVMSVPVVENGVNQYELRFRETDSQVDIVGGQLGGLIDVRDSHIVDMIGQVDQLAAGLIDIINNVHTNGQGLDGYTTMTGTNAVLDADLALNDPDAGLVYTPQTGSFYIAVTDQVSGLTSAYQIDIDLDGLNGDDTTLNSLAAQITAAIPNVTATVTTQNTLALTATPGFVFSFGHDGVASRDDSSNVLAALGVNTFFQGHNAADIAVNNALAARPELLAASSVNINGDGVNAGLLAAAGSTTSSVLDSTTLNDYYAQMIGELGVKSAAAQARLESADGVRVALETQRASISGVNLDEEAVELLKYERAFQGSARFTSVVDQLIAEMLNIIQ
ncbi:MAG: Flagellar hook-associated protein 1 [Phycisphaerae bacterium]|nr:Flagellar hook-associated protein 1 [Phycisphaerae bacterium]